MKFINSVMHTRTAQKSYMSVLVHQHDMRTTLYSILITLLCTQYLLLLLINQFFRFVTLFVVCLQETRIPALQHMYFTLFYSITTASCFVHFVVVLVITYIRVYTVTYLLTDSLYIPVQYIGTCYCYT